MDCAFPPQRVFGTSAQREVHRTIAEREQQWLSFLPWARGAAVGSGQIFGSQLTRGEGANANALHNT